MSSVAAPLPAPVPPRGLLAWVRGWFDIYTTSMRIAVATQFQYRVANYFYMIGMVAEPVIYLVVWSTVAPSSGSSFTMAVNCRWDGFAFVCIWIRRRTANQRLCRPAFPVASSH